MLPDEIYVSSTSSSNKQAKLKYSHPLNHEAVNDGSLHTRLAYDLMTFMKNSECEYYINPDNDSGTAFNPQNSDDEIDIMITDGFYKEAEMLVDHRLAKNPNCERSLFQKAFIMHLKDEYSKIIHREDKVLVTDPLNVNALINKGFALANIGLEEEALRVVNKALEIDPENMTALGNKAYIAKAMNNDELREQTLVHAYNVSAKQRLEELEEVEARLLEDMDSIFINSEAPSAFDAFNQKSGIQSSSVH